MSAWVRTLPKKASDKQIVCSMQTEGAKRKKKENKLQPTEAILVNGEQSEMERAHKTMSDNEEMSGAKMCTLMRKEMWSL